MLCHNVTIKGLLNVSEFLKESTIYTVAIVKGDNIVIHVLRKFCEDDIIHYMH